MADRVIIELGPTGGIKAVKFEGSSASNMRGGRLRGWLSRLMLEAKRARSAKKIKMRYDVDVDKSPGAEKKDKPRAKMAPQKPTPAKSVPKSKQV